MYLEIYINSYLEIYINRYLQIYINRYLEREMQQEPKTMESEDDCNDFK